MSSAQTGEQLAASCQHESGKGFSGLYRAKPAHERPKAASPRTADSASPYPQNPFPNP